MSQGIAAALTHLEGMIMDVTPKRDVHHGFVALARGDGSTPPLTQRSNSTRFFTLDISGFTEDDGAAGLSGRRRSTINLNVRYDIPRDALYDLVNTGIVSVIPEAPILTPVDAVNDTGAFILTLPFVLLYLEA